MTAPKSTLRQRRPVSAKDLPDELAAWFAGESSIAPWAALLPGDFERLPERWAAWKAEHPDAQPPAGYEWLNEISTDVKGKTP